MTEETDRFTCNSCGKVFSSGPNSSTRQPGEKAEARCPHCGSQYVSQIYSVNKGYTCHPCS